MAEFSNERGYELLPAREGVRIMREVARLVASGEQALEWVTSPVAKARIRESLERNYEQLGAYYVECPFK